jgi:hypothetical protein
MPVQMANTPQKIAAMRRMKAKMKMRFKNLIMSNPRG